MGRYAAADSPTVTPRVTLTHLPARACHLSLSSPHPTTHVTHLSHLPSRLTLRQRIATPSRDRAETDPAHALPHAAPLQLASDPVAALATDPVAERLQAVCSALSKEPTHLASQEEKPPPTARPSAEPEDEAEAGEAGEAGGARRPSQLTDVAGRQAADERRARVKANLEAKSPVDPEEIVPEVSEEVPEISAEVAKFSLHLPPLPASGSGSPDLRGSSAEDLRNRAEMNRAEALSAELNRAEEKEAGADESFRELSKGTSRVDSEGTVDSELERGLAAVEAEVEAARMEADAAEEALAGVQGRQEAFRAAKETEEAVEYEKSQGPEGLSMALKLAKQRAEVVEVEGSQTAEEAEAAGAAEAEAKEKVLADEVERQGELRLAERHGQTALAHSSPLQRPTRLRKAAPWAREEHPRRLDAEVRLPQRSDSHPKVADSPPPLTL